MENILPQRKTIRIPGYDYSQNGYYFITICTYNRKKILSEINDGKIILYKYGKIVEQEILKTNEIRKNVTINNYVIMPNHIHMIIEIINVGVAWNATPNDKLERGKMIIPKVIQQIKLITQKLAKENEMGNGLHTMQPLQWQRNYYEHVIRGENEYLEICQYIENNPLKWEEDLYNK